MNLSLQSLELFAQCRRDDHRHLKLRSSSVCFRWFVECWDEQLSCAQTETDRNFQKRRKTWWIKVKRVVISPRAIKIRCANYAVFLSFPYRSSECTSELLLPHVALLGLCQISNFKETSCSMIKEKSWRRNTWKLVLMFAAAVFTSHSTRPISQRNFFIYVNASGHQHEK